MIVRDNETTIAAALESIRPWVDEIIIVDTGSKDGTLDICRRFGARIYHFPWCDDFSAARNESLKHARGEWIFWMDSDDTISEECGRQLRELADGPHADNVLGYVMQVHCPGSGEEGQHDVTAVDHVKLIRNRDDLRFEGRIHEQLMPAIRRARADVVWTNIHVRHSGADHSPEGFRRKLDRDLRILHRELQDAPDHPFVLFNLGMTYADAKRFDEAIGYLERCLTVSKSDESHLRKAYALIVASLAQTGRHDEALARCQEGLALYPTDKELLFRLAILHHHFGRLVDAEQTYLRVLNGVEERHLTSIDQGLVSYKARHNLAIVYDDMGRQDKAEEQWRLIVKEVPDYRPGWIGLGESLLKIGHLEQFAALTAQASARASLGATGRLLQSRICERRGDAAGARQGLETARREWPQELVPLRELCRLLFERGAPEEAATALRELTDRDPRDASAFHNLGTIYCQLGRFDAAMEAYRQSLNLRPISEVTLKQFEFAAARAAGAVCPA
jgi:tetratricopeptide (TPR) repeat protein